MGQSLIQSCTVISLWSWLAASSSLSEPHAGALHASLLLSDGVLQKQHSASASPCKSWPVSGQGFALSLLHAGQMPAVFLVLSVSKCQREDASFSVLASLSTCLPCPLWCSPCNLPALPSFAPPFCPYRQNNLVFLVEKLFLPLKLDRNEAVKAPNLDVESLVRSVILPEPKLSRHPRQR